MAARQPDNVELAVKIIRAICSQAGSKNLLDQVANDARETGLSMAIDSGNTPFLFDWLVEGFGYQGVSDAVARSYIERNGQATWRQIRRGLKAQARSDTEVGCPRLTNYWTFERCGYDKQSASCWEPEQNASCPLPAFKLRNGRLNQMAYSFYFFVRDIMQGDIVGWIDSQLADAGREVEAQHRGLIEPLRNVYGISDKLLNMTLATLLTSAPVSRPLWFKAGCQMIAIDTLVHNFLCRTGILKAASAAHLYGAHCYAAGGCADIIRKVSAMIDARDFNPEFPKRFDRFVQHAIWRHCAEDGLGICNGNRIDDRRRCQNTYCNAYTDCGRIPLRPRPKLAKNAIKSVV